MQGKKALQVPFYYIDRVFLQAFSHVANVRHAQVDAGYRMTGEGALRKVIAAHAPCLSQMYCAASNQFRADGAPAERPDAMVAGMLLQGSQLNRIDPTSRV